MARVNSQRRVRNVSRGEDAIKDAMEGNGEVQKKDQAFEGVWYHYARAHGRVRGDSCSWLCWVSSSFPENRGASS
jgi:hypothetical protein